MIYNDLRMFHPVIKIIILNALIGSYLGGKLNAQTSLNDIKVSLATSKGICTPNSFGWYPTSGELPAVSDRYGNGDDFSRPSVYERGEFSDLALIALYPGPIERARNFRFNEMKLIPEGNSLITRWTISPETVSKTGFTIYSQVIRRPKQVRFRVKNKSEQSISLQPEYIESSCRKWKNSSWKLGSAAKIKAGEEREVIIDFNQVESLHPENIAERGYVQPVFPGVIKVNLSDLKIGESYILQLSDYAVVYGYAEKGKVRSISLPAMIQVGKRIPVNVTAKEMNRNDIIDFEVRREDRTLWRYRLNAGERKNLEKKGSVKLFLIVPEFLSSGNYTSGLVSNGYRIEGNEGKIQIVNPVKTELPEVQIRPYLGRNSIVVNGNPIPWIGRNSLAMKSGDTGSFAEAGADFIIDTSTGAGTTMSDEPSWKGTGPADFSELDQRVAMVLGAKPDARIMICANLALPPLWGQNNPDEVSKALSEDGTEAVTEVHSLKLASFASEKWQIEQEKLLRELVRHVKNQPWASNIIAFWLCSRPHEWFFNGSSNEFWDYSQPNQKRFQEYTGKNSFIGKTAGIPSPTERKGNGLDFHSGTESGRLTVAYNYYDDDLTARVIQRFARAVKEETGGKSLVGVHYGYIWTLYYGRSRTISSMCEIFESPYIDFIAGVVLPKAQWGLNAFDIYMSPLRSLFLRGKHYVVSNDHTFYLTQLGNIPVYDPDNVHQGDRYMQQRVIAQAATHGVSPRWFGLGPTWWSDQPTQKIIKEMIDVYKKTFSLDVTSREEVALVIDDHSFPWLAEPVPDQLNPGFIRSQTYYLYRYLQRTGTPVGSWLLSDIDKLPEKIKAVIVCFAAAPRTEDLNKLKELIDQGGKLIAVIGRPGLINSKTGHWNLDGPSKLLGLPIRISHDTSQYAMISSRPLKIDETPGKLTGEGLPNSKTVLAEKAFCPRPRAVVDGGALLNYENGEGAFAERPLSNGGRLIWCSTSPLNSDLWRKWLEKAGVHFYAPLNYFVHATKELVSVTAPEDGQAEINFPSSVVVKDLFEPGKTGKGKQIKFQFDRGQTRLFEVHRDTR
jgi:hypothetical protein